MSQFTKNWERPRTETLAGRVKDAVKNDNAPLKPRLDIAMKQIQLQLSKLEAVSGKLKDRDDSIFNKVVSSIQKHDMQHASVFANELAEVRKMNVMVTQSKLALEQIVMRFNTIQELGDIVVTLSPAMSIIKNVKTGLGNVLPESDNSLAEISSSLSSILVDAGQIGGYNMNFNAANEEAQNILAEASTVAEQTVRDKFPDLPTNSQEIQTEEFPSSESL